MESPTQKLQEWPPLWVVPHKNVKYPPKVRKKQWGQSWFSSFTVLSGLHTANLSWQTHVGKLQKVSTLVSAHVKLESNQNTFATWPSYLVQ